MAAVAEAAVAVKRVLKAAVTHIRKDANCESHLPPPFLVPTSCVRRLHFSVRRR